MTSVCASWDTERVSALLRGVPLFGGLSLSTIQRLAERFRPRLVPRGAFVFFEGQSADTLNLLAEGRIKVIRETEERQTILRLIHPGELFGVSGGWGEVVYPASARAMEDSIVLRMRASEFTSLLRSDTDLAMAVIQGLATRLREAESRILDLQTERVEQRIARVLIQLMESTGTDTERGIEIRASLSRQDLADLTGTTLSTASRTLSAWHRQGIVLAERERVTVIRPGDLAGIARGESE